MGTLALALQFFCKTVLNFSKTVLKQEGILIRKKMSPEDIAKSVYEFDPM